MKTPCYINLEEARAILAEMGINLNSRQIRRAAEPDAHGNRRLPFFVDPIEGRLKIEKDTLIRVYQELQINAENNWRNHEKSLDLK